jgi:hypothetical protein
VKKSEIVNLLETIVTYYPSYKIYNLEDRVEEFHRYLHDADYEQVMKNLDTHIKTDRFAPTIADLLKINANVGRAIPNVAETRALLQNKEMSDKLLGNGFTADSETAKAEARKLLGIDGGHHNA